MEWHSSLFTAMYGSHIIAEMTKVLSSSSTKAHMYGYMWKVQILQHDLKRYKFATISCVVDFAMISFTQNYWTFQLLQDFDVFTCGPTLSAAAKARCERIELLVPMWVCRLVFQFFATSRLSSNRCCSRYMSSSVCVRAQTLCLITSESSKALK